MAIETALKPMPPDRYDDRFTVEDFFAVIPDGQKADLIDGAIYVASPDTPRNNALAGFVQFLLDGYASRRRAGDVYASRVAFELSGYDAPEPDVAFVAAANLERVRDSKVIGGPDIAVEVISRDSRHRDSVTKKALYEAAGVTEYWLIDPRKRRAEFYRLVDGRYDVAPLGRNRIFRSEALPGFWIDVEWLFSQPFPDRLQCLQQILSGEPES